MTALTRSRGSSAGLNRAPLALLQGKKASGKPVNINSKKLVSWEQCKLKPASIPCVITLLTKFYHLTKVWTWCYDVQTAHQRSECLIVWDDPKAKHTKTVEKSVVPKWLMGAGGRVRIGLDDLGQRPKENSNEDSEGISLGLYTTTGCATWG